jgi:hypothetical protein
VQGDGACRHNIQNLKTGGIKWIMEVNEHLGCHLKPSIDLFIMNGKIDPPMNRDQLKSGLYMVKVIH